MSLSASPEVLDLCKQVVQTAQPVIEAVTSVQATNSQIIQYVTYGFVAGWLFAAIIHVLIDFVVAWFEAPKAVRND